MAHPMSLEEMRNKEIFIGVWLHKKGWVPAGVITFNEGLGFAGFSYFESYIQNDYPPLNPATLNHRDTRSRHFVVDPKANSQMLDRTFWELLPTKGDFGDVALVSRFPQYQSLNNAQKLYFFGHRMVGGIASHVKKIVEEESVDSPDWLDNVRRDAVAFHLREITRLKASPESFLAMTSYGGVRPKAMYKDSDGRHWIAKFNLPTDPYDMAVAEHVAIRMAHDAGLRAPETRVMQLPSGENVFLIERFDRQGEERLHSLSLHSLMPGVEINGRTPGSPKGNTAAVMATIVRRFSDFKDQDTANLVTKLLVDVGFNNTDNHLRNTRMILNAQNLWEISPAFDILFNPRSQPHIYNPAGLDLSETFLTNDALVEGMAGQTGLDASKVDQLRSKVLSVANNWESYCDMAGMADTDKLKIQAAVSLGVSRVEMDYRIKMEQRRKVEQALRSIAPKR